MTMANDPDPADVEALFDSIDELFDEAVEAGEYDQVQDFSGMSIPQLISELTKITEELKDRDELLFPRSDRGRELHSKHTAIRTTMNTREDEAPDS